MIKPSQYSNVQPRTSNYDCNESSVSMPMKDGKVNASDSVVLSSAFEKAKKIVDAANSYSMKHIKEATERMNIECAQVKKQSHDEAYAKGLSQGKSEGMDIGYKDGFQRGYEEGLDKSMQEGKVLFDQLTLTIEALENSKSALLEREEQNLSDLAIQIAELVIQTSVELDKKTIQPLVERIVEENQSKEWIKVNISTNVYEALEKAGFSKKISTVSSGVKLCQSKELGDSDCVIEISDGVIDASVNTQLSKIKAVLKR
ncbi:MAG: FliH/SctL family protein [Oscillospiraceae bacterium]